LNELLGWFNANSLILNTEKTTSMVFHSRQKRDLMEPQIKLGKIEIAYRSETKFLGMHVGKHMDRNAHIVFLNSKLNKVCYMIKSLRDATSPLVIRSIYFAYVHTHLKYGWIFWGGDSKSKTIFKLQKRVIRIIGGVSRLSSCRQLFKDLNLLPLPCMYIFELVCYIKSHFGELDQNIVVHNHNTRPYLVQHMFYLLEEFMLR
jgi:hypothetical protein